MGSRHIHLLSDAQVRLVEDHENSLDIFVPIYDVKANGDVVLLEGMDTRAYMRNPVFLRWCHYMDPPIGRVDEIEELGNWLRFRVRFADRADPEVSYIFRRAAAPGVQGTKQQMIRIGIGFIPVKWHYEEVTPETERVLWPKKKPTGFKRSKVTAYDKIMLVEISCSPW